MKGGAHQLQWDVRRTWACPECDKTQKTPGHVTAVACSCRDRATWMHLTDLPAAGFPNTTEALELAAAARAAFPPTAPADEPSQDSSEDAPLAESDGNETP